MDNGKDMQALYNLEYEMSVAKYHCKILKLSIYWNKILLDVLHKYVVNIWYIHIRI